MQYALLGNTGLVVSRMSFGSMTFTHGNRQVAALYKVGEKLANELVGRALDAGINFFDTADAYADGESELLLGRALSSKRNDLVITTKVGLRTGESLTQAGLNRRHILSSVDQSLKRLGTDWIDVYMVHKEDHLTPLEEILGALDEIVRAGKARYIAFSNWQAWKVSAALEIQKANGWARFTHGQMYYSLLGRDIERDVIPMMQGYGLGLTVWSPLASGFLSGKYTRANLTDPDNRYSGIDFLQFDKARAFELVEQMRSIAGQRDCSVAHIALSWLLSKTAVTSIILGASHLHQLEDNLSAIDVELTSDETAALDKATALAPVYPNWFIDATHDGAVRSAIGARGSVIGQR
jgi:aryl-alcohol dehydrogenase-like predicted oxidoreductase